MRLEDLGAVDRVQEDGSRAPRRDLRVVGGGGCRVSPGPPVTCAVWCQRPCRAGLVEGRLLAEEGGLEFSPSPSELPAGKYCAVYTCSEEKGRSLGT